MRTTVPSLCNAPFGNPLGHLEATLFPTLSRFQFEPEHLWRDHAIARTVLQSRPLFLVSTTNADGDADFAPFSIAGADPNALVMVIFDRGDGSIKRTLSNLRSDLRASLDTVDPIMCQRAQSPFEKPPLGASRFDVSGLSPEFNSYGVRIAQSPLSLGCRVVSELRIQRWQNLGEASVVTLAVERLFFRADIEDSFRADPQSLRILRKYTPSITR